MPRDQDLGAKLDALVRLTALQVVGDRKGKDAIELLGRAGLDTDLIAEMVDTSSATVRAALSRARRKGNRRR
jgi:DNA-directed RNA polymerase specialized sigma24 family protein